jgi:asparagine synthase (glutamine-hydrolysing)
VDAQQDLLKKLNGPTQVDNALQYILMTRLPSDYLTKIDVATMAHGLEARSPFLDVDLLEFAMTVPAERLIAKGQLKSLLKCYAEQIIPREVIFRRKQGFELPLAEWFRGKWYASVERLLLSTQAVGRGYFDPEVIRKVLDEHVSHRFNHTARLWTLLVFEIWNRLFVDRTLSPSETLY